VHDPDTAGSGFARPTSETHAAHCPVMTLQLQRKSIYAKRRLRRLLCCISDLPQGKWNFLSAQIAPAIKFVDTRKVKIAKQLHKARAATHPSYGLF